MKIDTSANISSYYNYCRNYNQNKALKYQLWTEINIGHFLLVLLCENIIKNIEISCVLLTNIHSLATQPNQSLKTIKRHMKTLHEAKVIIEHGKRKVTTGKNNYRVLFNAKLNYYTRIVDGNKVSESEETIVDNAIFALNEKLHPKKIQLT